MRIQVLENEIELPHRSRTALSFSITILLAMFFLLSGETATAQVKTSSLGNYPPTYVGLAAKGCKHDCSLLSGPYASPATAPISGPVTRVPGQTPTGSGDDPTA